MSGEPAQPDEMPAPLVPAYVDLRDLDGFMLNVERLLASELWALTVNCPEAFRAAVGLWARAWKQIPAASLPNDKNIIAGFVGLTVARLSKLWPLAMRGFILCSDGRYYHLVLAAEAMRAWQRKLAYQTRRAADQKRLSEWREKQRASRDETTDETRFVAEDTGQGQKGKKEKKEKKEPPTEPSVTTPAPGGAADYAFSGDVIRLTRSDHHKLRTQFKALNGSFEAELAKADAYYRDNPPRGGKWWFPLTKWLAKAAKDATGREEESW